MRDPIEVETARIRRCEIPLSESYRLSDVVGELTDAEPVVLELEAENGAVGLGETAPLVPFTQHSARSVVALLEEFLPATLAGVDATNPNAVHRRLDAVLGEQNRLAKAAVDIAVYDLLGKTVGRPTVELINGPVHAEFDVLQPIGNQPPEECARQVASQLDTGFSTFMLKTGHYPIETDLDRLRAVREATGEAADIIVDANQGWDVNKACEFASRAADYDVAFLEQPVPAGDVKGLAAVRESSPIPISADESLFSVGDAKRLLEADAVDVFSIKVAKHGGIRPAIRIIELADAHGVQCYMNSMIETGITQAASLQLGAATSCLADLGHAYMSPLRLSARVTDFDRQITDGVVSVPDGPGLGVTPTGRLDAVTATEVEVSIS